MNKQELIEKIKANGEWFETNRYVKITEAVELIKQLDEPQKVKVPEEFDEWYQQIKQRWSKNAKEFALWKICQFGFGNGFEDVNNDRTSSTLSDWVCWNKEVAINAVRNDYEVEEEPKWVVKVNNMYFLNWGEDGTCPTFVIDDAPRTKELAEKYESEQGAESVAEIFGGAVEKV